MKTQNIIANCNSFYFTNDDKYPFITDRLLSFLAQKIKASSSRDDFDENRLVTFDASAIIGEHMAPKAKVLNGIIL